MPRARKLALNTGHSLPDHAPIIEPLPLVERPSKLATLITLLRSPDGATIAAMREATGWQAHSVRGALAGTLKRKGFVVTSVKPEEGARRYQIGEAS